MLISIIGGGVSGEKSKDSVWEDWGTLGKIRGIITPLLKNPIKDDFNWRNFLQLSLRVCYVDYL